MNLLRAVPRTFRGRLAAVTAAGVVFQLAYVVLFQHDYSVWGDSYFYHEAGQLLADGFGWINPYIYETTGVEQQSADHPPLYIAFIALWSAVGVRSELAHMVVTTLVFGTAVIACSGLVARKVAGERTALIAAALVSLSPGVWGWHGTILSEPTAMLGVLLVALACYRYRERVTPWRAAVAGASITLAVFGRAEFLLLSVFAVVPIMLLDRSQPLPRRWVHLVVAGAACVATLAPWVAFNLSRFDETVLVSEGFPVTLATANCELTYFGEDTGYWNLNCAGNYLAAAGLDLENSTQPERSKAMQDGALEFIGENLDRVPTVIAARWARITSVWKPLEQAAVDSIIERRDLWVTQSAHLSFLLLAPAAVAGLVVLRRRGVPIAPLLGPLVTVFVAVTILFGQSRYRASVEPIVAVLAAVALGALVDWWRTALVDADAGTDVTTRATGTAGSTEVGHPDRAESVVTDG